MPGKHTTPMLPANPKTTDWQYFKRQFENYLLIVPVGKKAKLPLFQNCLGQDGINIYDGLPGPKDDLDDVLERFDQYFGLYASTLSKMKAFLQCHQSPNESIPEYACRLRRLYHDFKYESTDNTLIRDIFIIGICHDDIGGRLMEKMILLLMKQ